MDNKQKRLNSLKRSLFRVYSFKSCKKKKKKGERKSRVYNNVSKKLQNTP